MIIVTRHFVVRYYYLYFFQNYVNLNTWTFHLYGLVISFHSILESTTCDVTDEVFDSTDGVCKCGTATTCKGQPTGEVCDATNNVCKCSDALDACSNGQVCNSGACGKYNFGVQKQILAK